MHEFINALIDINAIILCIIMSELYSVKFKKCHCREPEARRKWIQSKIFSLEVK